jgi:ADP-heptose:LPS heptosyltransferase
VNKFLIFRTDRIGDFIFSRIITQAIKKKNPKNLIDIVSSKYSHNYIKSYKDIRYVYPFDKYDPLLLCKNFIKINSENYDYIIVLDGKRRSLFYSIILKSKYKLAVLKDFRPGLFLKLFFDKYFINTELTNQYDNFLTICNFLNLNIPDQIDYFKSHLIKKDKYEKFTKGTALLHLDEKWFEGLYHKDYAYMGLNSKNFDDLIKIIFKKFKRKIIITTGINEIKNLSKIINLHFEKKNKNIFISKKYLKRLIFIKKTNFFELESITKNCALIICCEGALSHVSHALKINTIALVNKKNIRTAKYWTSHMNKIKLIYRDNLKNICKQIDNVQF